MVKLKALLHEIKVDGIFGLCTSLCWRVEFQLRGLPHAHILVCLADPSRLTTPKSIDACISAEIPPAPPTTDDTPANTQIQALRNHITSTNLHQHCKPLTATSLPTYRMSPCILAVKTPTSKANSIARINSRVITPIQRSGMAATVTSHIAAVPKPVVVAPSIAPRKLISPIPIATLFHIPRTSPSATALTLTSRPSFHPFESSIFINISTSLPTASLFGPSPSWDP